MATPLTADRLLKALHDEGVTVVEVGNWRTHNRARHGAWGPVHGSIVHHTVTKGTANTVAMVRDGYTALPGPLCHGMIAKDGRVHLVGYGRTNHAGGGDPRVLDQVVAEDYGTRPIPPTRCNSNGVDGNARFYGWECENLGDGKDPWPAAQYNAIVRVQAALCRAHGWTAKSVIGHLEWSSDKVDPRGFGMPALRADVAERLTHPASWSPDDKTDPQSEEDTVTPAQEALLKKLTADVAELKKNAAVAPWTYRNAKLDAESKAAGNRIPDTHGRIEHLQTTLDAVATAVAELKNAS
ncbi:peptidoglycan recognition protein family protein [Streptomyces halstedii]|uniref:peptidoglycan recognition protein family protein n=1 Tax=Streptomyces halstedii TaxID=1944 RepID=UPI00380D2643